VLSCVHAPSASHNCSGCVARNLSWAKAARAAGLVSPSASAFNMRLALTPSRSETKLDNLIWAFFQKGLQLVVYPHQVAPQLGTSCALSFAIGVAPASGTKLSVSSRATSRFTKRSASTKSLLRPRRPRLDSACARCQRAGPPSGAFPLLAERLPIPFQCFPTRVSNIAPSTP